MRTATRLAVRAGALVGVLGLAASSAHADLTPEVFVVKATVDGDFGSFVVSTDDGWFDDDGNFYWSQDGQIQIRGQQGDVLATLTNSSITVLHDPVINMNFNVQASNQNTVFQVGSGVLSFPEISGPIGAASAAVTVTDVNGNGATLAPDGSSMYLSQYNGEVPNGTDFVALLGSSLSAGAFQTNATSEEYPGGGSFVAIGEPVESMSAEWTFTLSARDIASGTSTFIVIPTPSGAAVLGLAGLAVLRRRR